MKDTREQIFSALQAFMADIEMEIDNERTESLAINLHTDQILSIVQKIATAEHCICAAIKTTCGQVIRGHRHHDCISIAMANMLDPIGPEAQGFVTSTGRFVDRFEGYKLQVAAGIESIARGGYRGIRLFSEDLY